MAPNSLNRTSVGLKRFSLPRTPQKRPGPQSNQRGIETTQSLLEGWVLISPQLNQRGIETTFDPSRFTSDWKASIEPAWD